MASSPAESSWPFARRGFEFVPGDAQYFLLHREATFLSMGQYSIYWVPAKRSLVTATTTSIDLRTVRPSGSLSRLGLAARGWAFGARQ